MLTFWGKFGRSLRAFTKARAGNVAITFAFASLPVVGAVGAAVDYSHANSVKAAMQAALDSTALMVARDAPNLSDGDLDAKALNYFKAVFNRPEATNIWINATYSTSGGSSVLVEGTVDVATTFLGILNKPTITVGGTSMTKWGSTRLRVGLALDNTGSMADDGKMTALKSATKNLLDQLKAAASTNEDVYVSIIPFAKDVNIDVSYKSTYLDWTDFDNNEGSCNKDTRRKEYTKLGCLLALGTWAATPRSSWNGCVVDRGLPLLTSLLPPILNTDVNVLGVDLTSIATMYAPEQYDDCPEAVSQLGYDWKAMAKTVDKMKPAGNTNQVIGLQHAWMSLVGGGPYPTPPAEDRNYKYSKVIVLLTDGLNTENRWYASQSQIDARQKIACDNIKAAGITLYTVQVNTGGDPLQTTLKNCASSPDKFWMITSAGELGSVFTTIGTNLTQLRVAE